MDVWLDVKSVALINRSNIFNRNIFNTNKSKGDSNYVIVGQLNKMKGPSKICPIHIESRSDLARSGMWWSLKVRFGPRLLPRSRLGSPRWEVCSISRSHCQTMRESFSDLESLDRSNPGHSCCSSSFLFLCSSSYCKIHGHRVMASTRGLGVGNASNMQGISIGRSRASIGSSVGASSAGWWRSRQVGSRRPSYFAVADLTKFGNSHFRLGFGL